jgi:hypothetical protein
VAVACFIAWPLHFSFGQPPADGLAGLLFARCAASTSRSTRRRRCTSRWS